MSVVIDLDEFLIVVEIKYEDCIAEQMETDRLVHFKILHSANHGVWIQAYCQVQ